MKLLLRERKLPEWKVREVEELAELIKKYPVIGIADLTGLPSAQLQEIRKRLRGRALFRVAKNTLMKRAFEKAGIKVTKEIEELLQGPNMFIFTDMNPFELYLTLEKYKAKAPAKPGDVATSEIVIPAGNTGLTPGPILSTFGKLKIPTKIQDGTIWITKDVTVAKPGDVISEELAGLLQKLGIEPIEIKVKLKAAYDRGLIIKEDQLRIDVDEYKNMIMEAHRNALAVGIEAAFPVPEVLELAVAKAYINALAVAVEAGIVTPETAKYVIAKAVAAANALAALIAPKAPELGIEVAAQPAPAAKEEKAEEKEEEEEKKEEMTEEELAAGLEALFG